MAFFSNLFAGMKRTLKGVFTRSASPPGQPTSPPVSQAPLTPEELMQIAMQEAMQLTETTEDSVEKGIFQFLAMACYILPFVLAYLVGNWLGEGLAGILHASEEQKGAYSQVSIVVEMMVPIASIAAARGLKRARVDPSAMSMTIGATVVFFLISAGSAIAQWVLYTSSYSVVPANIAVVALFRGCAPVLGDLICATFLALHGYKSLKQKIAQLTERADAVKIIFEKQAAIIDQSEKQRKERADSEAERERRTKKEEMIDRVYEMMGDSFVSAMEGYLSLGPGAANSNGTGSRQQRGY